MNINKSLTSLPKALILVFGLSTLAQVADAQVAEKSGTVRIENNRDVQRWRNSTGLTDFNIEFRGKIEVTDDDKDIKSISDDGYLEIEKTVFGSRRAIIIESIGGRIKKDYYEGRTKMEWEPAGRQWLAEILPDIVRSTTISAESRVDRFFKQGGSKAVLAEISLIESDYVKAHYGKLLLGKNISTAEMPAVISGLCNEIKSDYYLSSVLQSNIEKLLTSSTAADAFFEGVSNISSDYYKASLLKEAIEKYAASPDQVKTILKTATQINSDYYLSTVLTALLNTGNVKDESLNEMITVSKNIDSDYYRSVVLSKVLEKPGVSPAMVKNVVSAVADVDSDYYKTTVINSLVEKAEMDESSQVQVIVILNNSVNSDYYCSVALRNLMKNQKLTDESFKQWLNVASKLSSDYYASEILRDASDRTLTKSQLMLVCTSAANLDSDHYLTTVLTSIAPQVRNSDDEVKASYRQAARKISSETYYGRALRAIE